MYPRESLLVLQSTNDPFLSVTSIGLPPPGYYPNHNWTYQSYWYTRCVQYSQYSARLWRPRVNGVQLVWRYVLGLTDPHDPRTGRHFRGYRRKRGTCRIKRVGSLRSEGAMHRGCWNRWDCLIPWLFRRLSRISGLLSHHWKWVLSASSTSVCGLRCRAKSTLRSKKMCGAASSRSFQKVPPCRLCII